MTVAPVKPETGQAQVVGFHTGNEMAALSAKQIRFHLMGYYPITPSTEIAEILDEMKAAGEHDIVMVPADGEHGAAGICYGASTGGGRVFNATSSQGLLYSLEELPVQSGTRFPMLLDLATRAVSGPLDIRGDHSDVYYALNTGWLIFMARDPQAVYDLNLIALRVAERADVRLPAIVAFDGFFTSHQKRRVSSFEDDATVHDWLGPTPEMVTALDPRHPVTIGPYMNDPDLINNKYQLEQAMNAAQAALPDVIAEYEALSGRRYDPVDLYRMDDAEVAVFLLNSAAETAKDVADRLREQGVRAGVISPNVIRPFPADAIREALRGVRAVVLAERSSSFGGHGSNLSHEVKSALKDDPENRTLCLSRVYGLGGRDFYAEDAEAFFRLATDAAEKVAVLRETAELWEKRGGDADRARHDPRDAGRAAPAERDPRKHRRAARSAAAGRDPPERRPRLAPARAAVLRHQSLFDEGRREAGSRADQPLRNLLPQHPRRLGPFRPPLCALDSVSPCGEGSGRGDGRKRRDSWMEVNRAFNPAGRAEQSGVVKARPHRRDPAQHLALVLPVDAGVADGVVDTIGDHGDLKEQSGQCQIGPHLGQALQRYRLVVVGGPDELGD